MVLSMQMLVKTMEELQRLAEEGIDAVFGAVKRPQFPPRDAVVQRNISEGTGPAQSDAPDAGPSKPIPRGAQTAPAETNPKEQRTVDTNLQDDMLKLVRYKILSVERENERVLHDGEALVHDNMDGTDFAAWKIAEFIQTQQPDLRHSEKKYLRVYYEILKRYPREKFKFEEKQIEVLREIKDCLCTSRASQALPAPIPAAQAAPAQPPAPPAAPPQP